MTLQQASGDAYGGASRGTNVEMTGDLNTRAHSSPAWQPGGPRMEGIADPPRLRLGRDRSAFASEMLMATGGHGPLPAGPGLSAIEPQDRHRRSEWDPQSPGVNGRCQAGRATEPAQPRGARRGMLATEGTGRAVPRARRASLCPEPRGQVSPVLLGREAPRGPRWRCQVRWLTGRSAGGEEEKLLGWRSRR